MSNNLTNTITIVFFTFFIPMTYYAFYKFEEHSIEIQKKNEQSHHTLGLARCENNGGFHHKQRTGKYGFMVYICNDGVILYDVDGYPSTVHNYSD